MADNLSRGALTITNLDIDELNSILIRIRDELDELHGLRGSLTINDTLTVNDQINLKTLKATDSDGNLIHGFGDI